MAGAAIVIKISGCVVRFFGLRKGGIMAAKAIGRRSGVSVTVAILALDGSMRTFKSKRCQGVVKCRRSPGSHFVALAAIL